MRTIHYFNNLRTFLVCIVVIVHTSSNYAPVSFLPENENLSIPGIGSFILLMRCFVMHLFFFTSGYFVPTSFKSNGFHNFIKKKIIRLAIPAIIFIPLGFGHLWFLEDIFVLSLIFALIEHYLHKENGECAIKFSLIIVLLGALITGGVSYWINSKIMSGPTAIFKIIITDFVRAPQYLLMFCFGILACKNNWIEEIHNRQAVCCLLISFPLLIGAALYNGWGESNSVNHQWYTLYEAVMGLFFCFFLLWFFYKFCNKTNKFLSLMASLSFGIHIFHMVVLYALLYSSKYLPSHLYLHMICIFLLTLLVTSVFVYTIKQIPFIRRIL